MEPNEILEELRKRKSQIEKLQEMTNELKYQFKAEVNELVISGHDDFDKLLIETEEGSEFYLNTYEVKKLRDKLDEFLAITGEQDKVELGSLYNEIDAEGNKGTEFVRMSIIRDILVKHGMNEKESDWDINK